MNTLDIIVSDYKRAVNKQPPSEDIRQHDIAKRAITAALEQFYVKDLPLYSTKTAFELRGLLYNRIRSQNSNIIGKVGMPDVTNLFLAFNAKGNDVIDIGILQGWCRRDRITVNTANSLLLECCAYIFESVSKMKSLHAYLYNHSTDDRIKLVLQQRSGEFVSQTFDQILAPLRNFKHNTNQKIQENE